MGSELPEQPQSERRPRPILDEVMGMKERLSRMESIIQQAASLAVVEARRVDEIKETFEATVAAYETQLQEKEDTLNRENAVPGEQDQGLASQIRDLESRLREKEALLVTRDAEIKDLRSKVEEVSALAEREARHAQEMQESFEAAVAALKTQLGEKDELLNQKDIALSDVEKSLNGLEETLVNQICVLEDQLAEMVQKSGSVTPEQPEKKRSSRESSKQG